MGGVITGKKTSRTILALVTVLLMLGLGESMASVRIMDGEAAPSLAELVEGTAALGDG